MVKTSGVDSKSISSYITAGNTQISGTGGCVITADYVYLYCVFGVSNNVPILL